jgi:hypothetical protein
LRPDKAPRVAKAFDEPACNAPEAIVRARLPTV